MSTTAAHFIQAPYTGSVTDKPDPPLSPSELSDAMKPTTRAGLVYTGREQALVDAPTAPAPEGYTLRYSIDGGETWTETVPCGVQAGAYTVQVKYVSDTYSDLVLDPLTVTIGRASSGGRGSSHSASQTAAPAPVESRPWGRPSLHRRRHGRRLL